MNEECLPGNNDPLEGYSKRSKHNTKTAERGKHGNEDKSPITTGSINDQIGGKKGRKH